MRIVHVTDFALPRLGGLEVQVAALAERQAAAGHDVLVVTPTPGDPAEGVVRVTEGWRRPSALHPLAPFAAARAVAEAKPDVVHAHLGVGTPTAFWVLREAARSGRPVVATAHSFWTGWHAVFASLNAVAGYTRLPIVWSAVSDAAAAPVRRHVGDRVHVLPNGTDVAYWRTERAPREPVPLLVAVNRLARRKRPIPLLEVVRRVKELEPAQPFELAIAGDGPSRQAVERAVRRWELEDRVTLLGRLSQDEVRELHRQASAFIAPADLESFGIAALEAHCAGVPVVAKRHTGVAGFIRDGVDGLLVDDDEGLVQAVRAIVTDPDVRRRLAGSTPSLDLDWSAVLSQAEALYELASDRVTTP